MKYIYFSIKYRYSDISLKKHKLHLNRLFCCNHTFYYVNMVSVTSVPTALPRGAMGWSVVCARDITLSCSMFLAALFWKNGKQLLFSITIVKRMLLFKLANQRFHVSYIRQHFISLFELILDFE